MARFFESLAGTEGTPEHIIDCLFSTVGEVCNLAVASAALLGTTGGCEDKKVRLSPFM